MKKNSTNILPAEKREGKAKTKGSGRDNILFIVTGLIFLLHGITLLLPFIWMALTSFKSRLNYADSFLGLPKVWRWDNYGDIFHLLRVQQTTLEGTRTYYIYDMLSNSLTLAFVQSFFALLPCVLCSYVAARFNFKGAKVLFAMNLFCMIVPIQGSLANTLTVYKALNIYNNPLLYMILPGGCFGFNWLLLYGQYKAIPMSYSEAVQLDGGGHFTIFFKIILPMILPTLTALYILVFISTWNDYSASLLYLPSFPTIAYGLYIFQYDAAKYKASLPQILAGFTMCSIPSVVLFCSFQKVINRSLMVGGLKE